MMKKISENYEKSISISNPFDFTAHRYWVLFTVCLVNAMVIGFSSMCIPVLFSEISQDLNLKLNQLMFAWGLGPLATVFFNIPAGVLGDRFGIKRVGTFGLIGISIIGASRGMADSINTLMILFFLYGVSSSSISVNLPKTLGTFFPSKQLGFVNGMSMAAFGTGACLALLLSKTFFSPAVGGWRNLLMGLGFISLFISIIWYVTIDEDSGNQTTGPSIDFGSISANIRQLLLNKQIILLSFIFLLFLGGWQGISGSIPYLLEHERGWSPMASHGFITILLLAYVIGSLIIPAISDKVGIRKPFIITGLIIAGCGVFLSLYLSAIYPQNIAIWIIVFISSLFSGAVPLLFVIPLESPTIGSSLAGTATGIMNTAASLGGSIFPITLGIVFKIISGPLQIIFAATFCYLFAWCIAGILACFIKETGPKKQITGDKNSMDSIKSNAL